MKKTIYLLLIVLAPLTTLAQLKVDSLGKVQIGQACNSHESEPPTPMVSIGDNANYVWSDFGLYNIGLVDCKTPKADQESIGLYSEIYPTMYSSRTQPISTSIWGLSYGSTTSNFGVVGSLNGGKGAGIFGTTYYGADVQLSGSYAGYFDGNTYVNGNLTATAIYDISDIRLKKNITLLSEKAYTEGSAIAHLQKLNVIEYNLLNPIKRLGRYSQTERCKDYNDSNEAELNRRHFGLSAQELQEVYPNLVLEGQDGYLAVNYVELVPVLIRSIQELKQELDQVKSGSEAKTRSASDESADFSAITTGNVLYQNAPNPFKERTVIRFSLADGVQDASVCIFDMTGKTIKKLPVSSGMDSVSVGGYELGEGMFLYSLIVNGQVIDTKRMVISKQG